MIRLVARPGQCPEWIRDTILRLDEACFPADWRVRVDNCHWWLETENDIPVAYAALRPCQSENNQGIGFLSRVGVLRDWRGQGRQKRLIRRRVEYARRIGLEELVTYTVPENLASANSLISCGFRLYSPHHRWGSKNALYFRRRL